MGGCRNALGSAAKQARVLLCQQTDDTATSLFARAPNAGSQFRCATCGRTQAVDPAEETKVERSKPRRYEIYMATLGHRTQVVGISTGSFVSRLTGPFKPWCSLALLEIGMEAAESRQGYWRPHALHWGRKPAGPSALTSERPGAGASAAAA